MGEIVFALHFDKYSEVYLDECMVIGVSSRVHPNFNAESKHDLKEAISQTEIELFRITYDEKENHYILCDEDAPYMHPSDKVFKIKQEALLYLHGIISDISK